MKCLLVAASVVLSMWSCDGGTQSPSPGAPSVPVPQPGPAPPPANSYQLSDATLSGVVSEMGSDGQAPIEGVRVYCEACEPGHADAITDASGVYGFHGVWVSPLAPTTLWVNRSGYQDPAGLPAPTTSPSGPGWREVTVNGDTRFDIQLVRR
jgi:hypothetical protein